MGRLPGGVVGTVMTNFGLEQALGAVAIPFARSKVGDRYVLEELKRRSWEVGGEGSGHILCLDLNTTGDGIVSALQVLAAMDGRGTDAGRARAPEWRSCHRRWSTSAPRDPGRVVEMPA